MQTAGKVKALKILVLGMGAVLIGGFALLIWGVTGHRLGTGSASPVARPAAVAVPESTGFGAVNVPLPAGAHVDQMVAGPGTLTLKVGGAGPDRLIVLDTVNGRIVGEFVLGAAGP